MPPQPGIFSVSATPIIGKEVSLAIGFELDVRPLFCTSDVDVWQDYGLDLSPYEDVKEAYASEIYTRLEDGTCDEAWPQGRLSLFKQWMDERMEP